MKLSIKLLLPILLTIGFVNFGFAQVQKKFRYNAIVTTQDKQKVRGQITLISDTALTLVDKRNITSAINYKKISSIKVFKSHKDIGYAIVTGALAAGAIVTAQSIEDANTAILVGVGGTTAVVALSMILHGAIHGAEVKMKADREKIDYSTVSEKLSKYVNQ
ncbi:hypothetical protein [Nubsella zeaxanthinifaciens]|jgi:hypothetical protein|uniref:hypothetical protein n=1 Tax=Nubsella zeaxanthinifaciens TaxID=392412 RepID=UPI000DE43BFA|nr:hypothetical protein [Nubsella zeaxanthinifaciens]